MTKELTFEEQQLVAYTFLDAFYNRADFGYDVKRWEPSDVTQEIIDIVNQMGQEMVTNSRVVSVAEMFFAISKSLAQCRNFIAALIDFVLNGGIGTIVNNSEALEATYQNLIEARLKLRKNRFAWAVVTQIMAREKQNIEMYFSGLI